MNQGFFGIQYGEAIRPYRVNFRINPGASQYAGEALVIGCTDFTSPTLVSRGSGAPTFNVPHYVLQLPYSAGRVRQAPTAVAPLCVQIPDGGITGGNARGVGAVDFQSTRAAATQVASGARSFVNGRNNTVAGADSFCHGNNNSVSGVESGCIGNQNTVSAGQSFSVGYNQFCLGSNYNYTFGFQNAAAATCTFAGGSNSNANADYSFAWGNGANSRGVIGSFQISGSYRAASGDRNIRVIPLCAVTTNATATVLTTNAAAEATNNTWVLPNNCTGLFQGWIVARNTANNDSIGWKFEGMVSRDGSAATVALLGAVTPAAVGTADAGMSTCVLAVGVNTTNGSLIVTATGIAATTIAWHGAITPAFENA